MMNTTNNAARLAGFRISAVSAETIAQATAAPHVNGWAAYIVTVQTGRRTASELLRFGTDAYHVANLHGWNNATPVLAVRLAR